MNLIAMKASYDPEQVIVSYLYTRATSLFYYLLAAEAGIEVGNFNAAYLCEANTVGVGVGDINTAFRRMTVSLTNMFFLIYIASFTIFWPYVSHNASLIFCHLFRFIPQLPPQFFLFLQLFVRAFRPSPSILKMCPI